MSEKKLVTEDTVRPENKWAVGMASRFQKPQGVTLVDFIRAHDDATLGKAAPRNVLPFPLDTLIDDLATAFISIDEARAKIQQAQASPLIRNNSKYKIAFKEMYAKIAQTKKLLDDVNRFSEQLRLD